MSDPVPTNPTPKRKAKKRKPNAKAKDWKPAFISALRDCGNVREACRLARVDRTTAYDARKTDDPFAKQWESAIEDACDSLELEARRRAFKGVSEPVFYQGEVAGTVKRYSDTLLMFLLKGNRPDKFRDRFEHTGANGAPLPSAQTIIYLPDNGRERDQSTTPAGSANNLPIDAI
jgi:hypothetical protein